MHTCPQKIYIYMYIYFYLSYLYIREYCRSVSNDLELQAAAAIKYSLGDLPEIAEICAAVVEAATTAANFASAFK